MNEDVRIEQSWSQHDICCTPTQTHIYKEYWCCTNRQQLEVGRRPTAQSIQQMKYTVLWHQRGKFNSDLRQLAAPFNHLKHHTAGRPVD